MHQDFLYPALAELVTLIPPPVEPIAVGGDWSSFSAVNGFEPPTEWMALMSRYGCGSLGGAAVELHDPFPSDGTFASRSELDRRELRGAMREYEWFPDWGVWPDPGGFLPWASLRDGAGDIGWLTAGPSDAWRVAVLDRGGDGTPTELGTLDYLLELASHVDDQTFSQRGIGWMDERSFTPHRIPSGQLPTHEHLGVRFAAERYEPFDYDIDFRNRNPGEVVANVDRFMQSARDTWEQRLVSAADLLKRFAADGITFQQNGFRGTEPGVLAPTASMAYPVGGEGQAKEALAVLARAFGTTITEVTNLEGDPVWTELYDRPPT